jgi:phosphonoacetaldehyde hydrolase
MTKQPIRLVIFDWAGTTVDFGSRAPIAAFSGVFAAHGVNVTDDEARAPMGMNKREHLIAMFSNPAVADRWQAKHGRSWNEGDVDTMYHEFMPIQLETIKQHSGLVPNLAQVVAQLRQRGLRIGGTTGYFTEAANTVARIAAQAGFAPDANVCADDVPQGRPAPWMIFRVMERLGIYPPAAVVNVGDTIPDIQSGLAAGCWSVGVCDSSSLSGIAPDEYSRLSPAEKQEVLSATAAAFKKAGAHAVVNTIAELPQLIEQLEGKTIPTACC